MADNNSTKSRGRKLMAVMLMAISVFTACSKRSSTAEPLERTEVVLGTSCSIRIYENGTEAVMDKVFNRLKEIDKKMSVNVEDSEVIQVNKAAGSSFVKVSDDTFYVIKTGLKYGDFSGGRFDISIGPLVKLWGIGTDKARVPAQAEIQEKLSLVGYKDVLLNEEEKKVMLKRKGMALDLGGIAKGYAADEVVKVLKDNKIKYALINLGGDVMTYGTKVNGSPWVVGVQNPFSMRGEIVGTVKVAGGTVESSGDYERYFEENGKRYHHILSTTTGAPIDNELTGVTIITGTSIDGDGTSTTIFAMGLKDGLDFAEKNNIAVIFITKNKEVYVTKALKDKYDFKMTDSEFNLKN